MQPRTAFRFVPAWLSLFSLVLAFFAAGCGGGSQVETEPPEGWQASGDYWWTQGADTSKAFRDLSSVEAMGVVDGAPVLSANAKPTDEQVAFAAKKGLEKLYRKAPETVDSLFGEHIAAKISSVPRGGDIKEKMDAFSKKSHETLTKYFRPPSKKLQLGEDIPIGYPDSLFQQGVSGNVWMQVYVSAEGKPQAIKLLEGVHPVLNDTARRAITQMRWDPARVRTGNYGWKEIPSWTWVSLSFGQSS